MTETPKALFYHMTRTPIEATLPQILQRALDAGLRVVVRGTRAERLAWLDDLLWLGPAEGFLAHGLAGGPHDARQPVLLTTGTGRPNGAACLVALDGAGVDPDDCAALARLCVLFDGADPAAVEAARAQWRALQDGAMTLQYWSDETGRWALRTERPAGG